MTLSVSTDCLDVFPEALLMADAGGRIVAVNRHAAVLLRLQGGDQPEVTLRELADLSAAELDSLLHCCLATTAPVPLRLSFYPAGGRALDLRCEGWRCMLGGEVAAMLRVFDEVQAASRLAELAELINQLNQECLARRNSEGRLRSALAQLHDINSIRDHMLAQVSHDLRTPLNAILGMTEFMQTQPFGPLGGKYSEYIDDIHSSGDILLQLVDQVLHLAWADAHSRESSCETLADLSECLENCYRVVEPIARLRGLHIVVPRSGGMPKLRADQLLLKQILMNLLGNAAKYTGRGGHIEVTLEWRKGNVLAIQVKDDGPGIPRDKLAAINSGQVARSPYVIEDSQIGYGLALSRRTAKAIGGRLDIRSAVGRGTVASLVLPPNLVEAAPDTLH
jgi:signal transduction histidine kinase